MTVSSTTNVVTYTGNGVTTQFPYDFLIPTEDDLEVTILTIATGVLSDPLDPVDFSVTGIGDENGGEVVYAGLTADYKINIRRKLAIAQELDIPAQGTFFPNLLENQLDRIVMMLQQVNEELGRAVKVTLGDATSSDELIAALLEASADAITAASTASSASAAAAAAQAAAEAAQLAAELAAAGAVADTEALLAGYLADAQQAVTDAQAVAASIGDLDSLSDVDLTTTPPASGDGLTFNGTDWVPGAAGGGMFRGNNGTVGSRSGDIFRINAQTLTEDVTIDATENASATGPIAVETGNTLTVASGGTLAIV